MKSLFYAALFGILLVNRALPEAQASKESVDMRCFLVFDEDWRGGQEKSLSTPQFRNIRIAVVIKNLRKQEVSIATGAQPRLSTNPESSLVYLQLLRAQSYGGETRVPSIVEVMPSVLRLGEVAIIHADVRIPRSLIATDVTVVYEVDEFFAERFQVWQGKLVSRVVPISNKSVK